MFLNLNLICLSPTRADIPTAVLGSRVKAPGGIIVATTCWVFSQTASQTTNNQHKI